MLHPRNQQTEEEIAVMKDQLSLQETEIQNLQEELKKWREKYKNLEVDRNNEKDVMQRSVQNLEKQVVELRLQNQELEIDIQTVKEKTTQLHKDYQGSEAKCLILDEDLKKAHKENIRMLNLKQQNENLKKQLIIIGELYEALKDRYIRFASQATADEQFLIEEQSRKREIKGLIFLIV